MEYFDSVPTSGRLTPSVVTIGKFDGVHTGHRAVLDRLISIARARELRSVVVTFDRHPLALLAPADCPAPLVSNQQKRELLEASGVDTMLMLRFDRALADLAPSDFAEQILVDALGARVVLAGSDFRFGHRGQGDVDSLRELGRVHGFEVVPIDDVRAGEPLPEAGGRRASSTWIREALDAGRVREAARVLGRAPTVRSVVVTGERRGRELGYPTANLDPTRLEGFLPADGVYAAWATVDGVRHPAAVSIGNNPTFDGVPQHQAEAHLLDVDLDLYGRSIELAFVDFVRGMQKFDSLDSLVAAIRGDADDARRILDAAS